MIFEFNLYSPAMVFSLLISSHSQVGLFAFVCRFICGMMTFSGYHLSIPFSFFPFEHFLVRKSHEDDCSDFYFIGGLHSSLFLCFILKFRRTDAPIILIAIIVLIGTSSKMLC